MGMFSFFKKESVKPEDVDYTSKAEEFEKMNDFSSAIGEYEKIIKYVYKDKQPKYYRHITQKIVKCLVNMSDFDKVFEQWPLQFDPTEYGPKQMYDLIKILDAANRSDLVLRVYDSAGNSLLGNKIEYLIKIKKIPEANALLSELLIKFPESNPKIIGLWLTKAKISMGLLKWDEANKYLGKILEKDSHNVEARKLKDFCLKQIRDA